MSYLQIRNASKKIGQTNILENLSLQVKKGELVTLLGSSGCGKSTLLRCISGLLSMEEGEIYLEDQEITHVLPKDRGVGMVFQSYALFPNMNVFENIAFGLKMHRMTKQDIRLRVDEMVRVVGLEDKVHSYPHELSGGQQQRVALARSLAIQPKLLLLDEPLSALDAKIRKNVRMELRRIQKQLGMTTVFVTHDQEEALTLSDRVCVMDQGRIVQMGTPDEIYTNPRNEFVARFIGNYNVLHADQMKLFKANTQLAGTQFAIRPESICLYSLESNACLQDQAGIEAEGQIEEIVLLGNVLRFTVNVEGLQITVDELNGKSRESFKVGAKVKLWIPTEECKVLENGGV